MEISDDVNKEKACEDEFLTMAKIKNKDFDWFKDQLLKLELNVAFYRANVANSSCPYIFVRRDEHLSYFESCHPAIEDNLYVICERVRKVDKKQKVDFVTKIYSLLLLSSGVIKWKVVGVVVIIEMVVIFFVFVFRVSYFSFSVLLKIRIILV